MKTKRVRVRQSNGSVSVNAHVFGQWAAHESVGSYGTMWGYWSLTHLPSGMALHREMSMPAAVRAAETLHCAGATFTRAQASALPMATQNEILSHCSSALGFVPFYVAPGGEVEARRAS